MRIRLEHKHARPFQIRGIVFHDKPVSDRPEALSDREAVGCQLIMAVIRHP